MEGKELAHVNIVESGKVVKSWRIKGCGEHMPWFAERFMGAVERYIDGFQSKVDAVLIDMGIGNNWEVKVTSCDEKANANISIERTAIDIAPDINVTVTNEKSVISIVDCTVDDCFSVAVECMKCLEELE